MNTDKTADQEVMVIQEAADGGAVVDLPASIPSPEANQHDDHHGSDEADEAEKRAEIQATGSIDPIAEAAREAKRAKRRMRKDYHKQVSVEKDIKLQQLERQNQQLLERLSIVERKTLGSELARLDKRIEDEQSRVIFAKQKIKEAAETGNGDLMVSAQDMLIEASKNHEALTNLKQRSVAPQRQQTIQPVDPMLQRHAANWMAKNSWYDPNGKDPDSRRALNEDQILAEEGYDPKTADYWEELDRRLQRVVPHRYTDDMDEIPVRTQRPRNVVTGSGRESATRAGGQNTFVLAPEKVKAMKEAGLWDDPEKRARMIKRYALEARNNNQG
jgi:hypothetical protein